MRVVPTGETPFVQAPQAQGALPKGTLLYVVGDESSFVFTYPHGKLLHELPLTGYSACSDSRGNVFVTQVGVIAKYEHGATKPSETYKVSGSAYSCSISPQTHDLATVVFCFRGCGDVLVIFRNHGRNRSRYHVAPLDSLLYCAYDRDGDLFVDGYNGTRFALAELPSGANKFIAISLNRQIKYAAQIQWDGKNLAVETREDPTIYRIAISGSHGRVVGRTHLDGVGFKATQSWISDGTIAVPSAPFRKRALEVFFWNYPAGGQPIKILKGFIRGRNHAMIDGVTFSVPR